MKTFLLIVMVLIFMLEEYRIGSMTRENTKLKMALLGVPTDSMYFSCVKCSHINKVNILSKYELKSDTTNGKK